MHFLNLLILKGDMSFVDFSIYSRDLQQVKRDFEFQETHFESDKLAIIDKLWQHCVFKYWLLFPNI